MEYTGPLASSADRAVARVDRMHVFNPSKGWFRGPQLAQALLKAGALRINNRH